MKANIEKMYNGSYFTIEGVNDFEEWKNGLTKIMKKEGIGEIEPEDWETTNGKEMNSELHLTGSNAYPDDINILGFALTHIKNVGELAMWKLRFEARWFDDLVDNNLDREGLNWDMLA